MRIGIYGYGNLGRGIECAIKNNNDMELVAVFTRRDPQSVKIQTEAARVCAAADVDKFKDKIDVMVICGGSATDLPKQTPELAKMFNVVDSILPMWTKRPKRVAILPLSLPAGIQACFL